MATAQDEIRVEDCEGDEAGEPEQHGDGIQGESRDWMREAGEFPTQGHQRKVRGDEHGPYGAEDQEVDLRRRIVDPAVVNVPVTHVAVEAKGN